MNELLGKPKAWAIIAALTVLVIALLGWFLLISPQLSNVATLQAETETAQTQTQTLRAREAALTRQLDELPALRAKLADLYAQLPSESDVADLVRQIDAANQASGIRVLEFTVDPPAAVTLPEAAAAATPPPADDAGTGDATAEEATPTPAEPAGPELDYSTVSISLDAAPFGQVIAYLNAIENLDRALLLNSVEIADAGDGNVTLQVTGRIYTRPLTPAEEQAQTAGTDATTAQPSASPSP